MLEDNIQKDNLEESTWCWITAKPDLVDTVSNFYCETRDIFQARLDSMSQYLLRGKIQEETVYIISAIVGKIDKYKQSNRQNNP